MAMRHIREESNASIFHFREFIAPLEMFPGHQCIWEWRRCWLAARRSSKPRSAWLARKAAFCGRPRFFFCLQRYFLPLTHLRLCPWLKTQNIKVRKARDRDAYQDLPGQNLARKPVEKTVRLHVKLHQLLAQGWLGHLLVGTLNSECFLLTDTGRADSQSKM